MIEVENKKYERIIAVADVENLASARVLDKAGHVKGALRRECHELAVMSGKKGDL